MATTASATTWTVTGATDSLTNVVPCDQTTHKCTTLRAAINTAQKGDTISMAGLTGTIALAGPLPTMFYGVTIDGPGANILTISGQGKYGVFFVPLFPFGPLTISKLTLAGALGGAIDDLSGKNLSIDMCAFVDNSNTSGDGGAIEAGTVIVTNSTFSGNSASGSGGAVYAASLTVTNSTFSGNSATELGGAIHTAALMASNNIFSGNLAGGNGGAIFISLGAPSPSEGYNLFYENAGGDANFTLDSTDLSSSTSGKKTNLNPMLLPLGNYGGPTETMMPQVDSAAICTGSAADVPSGVTTDQRGFPIAPPGGVGDGGCANSGKVDIGSVQTNYLLVMNTGGDSSTVGSLPYEVSLANGQPYADIGFSPSLVSATIVLSRPLSLSSGDTVIIGPPDAVTISSGRPDQILRTTGSSTTVTLYGLTLVDAGAGWHGAAH